MPGLYGIKNVKWIVEIEVYPGDYHGYWQRKGWTDDGTIKIFSRIDSPGHYQTLRGHEQAFRGIAFGGPNIYQQSGNEFRCRPNMERVPRSNRPCRPIPGSSGTTHGDRRSGKFQTVVRATDTKGQLQIAEIVRPQPAGASGPHHYCGSD